MNAIELRTVPVTRDAADRLVCRRRHWDLMLELGRTFGWKPQGTSYQSSSINAVNAAPVRQHDYVPGSQRDAKTIPASDAFAWAAALQIALESGHLDAMIAAHNSEQPAQSAATPENESSNLHRGARSATRVDNPDIRDFTAQFAMFLRRGSLNFFVQDDSEAPVAREAQSTEDRFEPETS